VSNVMTPVSRSTLSLQPVRRSSLVSLVYLYGSVNFRHSAETTELFRPKLYLCRKSYINIRWKTELAETVQNVVFGAETETEFRSFSTTHTYTHTHNHFTVLWTLSVTTRASWYQKVHFAIWIFWCKMKITQADAPTVRMDCHPIQTNWCPHLCHPHPFYAGCPSWHNPPNLFWLGTGTKHAGLHTQWHGFYVRQHICYSAYMPWQFRLSVCPSVRLSHGWISQKRLKLGSRNFHHAVATSL